MDKFRNDILRSDRILFWTVVVVGAFLACTEISETRTLVHIKSGEYTASELQPARQGVFSYTAEERPWSNIGWLFDLMLFVVHAIGSDIGLSIFKAVIAAFVVFLVLKNNLAGVSVWWNVVCVALLTIAVSPQMTALPEIVTFLGVTLVVRLLYLWRETSSTKYLVYLPIVFAVWSNLDPRLFLGLAILSLFLAGNTIGRWVKHPNVDESLNTRRLWFCLAACSIASMLNPFGWDVLFYPFRLYGIVDPAMREYFFQVNDERHLFYFPVTSNFFWSTLTWSSATSLLLVLMAIVSLTLNKKRTHPGDWFVLLGFLGFGILAIRELPVVALLACLVGVRNAQNWYRDTVLETSWVGLGERLFSNGGRIVTFLGICSLSFLALYGMFNHSEKRRIGFGFDFAIEESIEGFSKALAGAFDDKPFHFQRFEGDVLIWIGKEVCIDSRDELYAGRGSNNLLANHVRICLAITNSARNETGYDDWQPFFNDNRITHVVPRLDSRISRNPPDYMTFIGMLQSKDWQIVSLNSVTAVFYRTDIASLNSFRKEHSVNFLKLAFSDRNFARSVSRSSIPKRSFFDKAIRRPVFHTSNPSLLAQHYFLNLELAVASGSMELGLSFAHLAIRYANAGLAMHPNDPEGFTVLGNTYRVLGELERGILRPPWIDSQNFRSKNVRQLWMTSLDEFESRRFYQAVHAYREALRVNPRHLPALKELAKIYKRNERWDLALEAYSTLSRELGCLNRTDYFSTLFLAKIEKKKFEIRKKIETSCREVRSRLKEFHRKNEHPNQSARLDAFTKAKEWYRAGLVIRASETLKKYRHSIENIFEASLLEAQLHLERGACRQAHRTLDEMISRGGLPGHVKWRSLKALAYLMDADYSNAINYWRKNYFAIRNEQVSKALSAVAFQIRPYDMISRNWADYVVERNDLVKASLIDLLHLASVSVFQASLTSIEQGICTGIEEDFRTIQKMTETSPFYDLMIVYTRLLPAKPSNDSR